LGLVCDLPAAGTVDAWALKSVLDTSKRWKTLALTVAPKMVSRVDTIGPTLSKLEQLTLVISCHAGPRCKLGRVFKATTALVTLRIDRVDLISHESWALVSFPALMELQLKSQKLTTAQMDALSRIMFGNLEKLYLNSFDIAQGILSRTVHTTLQSLAINHSGTDPQYVQLLGWLDNCRHVEKLWLLSPSEDFLRGLADGSTLPNLQYLTIKQDFHELPHRGATQVYVAEMVSLGRQRLRREGTFRLIVRRLSLERSRDLVVFYEGWKEEVKRSPLEPLVETLDLHITGFIFEDLEDVPSSDLVVLNHIKNTLLQIKAMAIRSYAEVYVSILLHMIILILIFIRPRRRTT
jgi:hypothetical protein